MPSCLFMHAQLKSSHRGFGIRSSGIKVALVASARLSVSMSTMEIGQKLHMVHAR